jgi:hypothetical protein
MTPFFSTLQIKEIADETVHQQNSVTPKAKNQMCKRFCAQKLKKSNFFLFGKFSFVRCPFRLNKKAKLGKNLELFTEKDEIFIKVCAVVMSHCACNLVAGQSWREISENRSMQSFTFWIVTCEMT